MAEDKLDEIREVLAEVTQRLNNVAKEQELFAREMRQLHDSQEEFHASMEELRASQKKTDEQQKKTDEQLKKTDEQQKKTDEEIKSAHAETEEEIKKMAKEVGKVTGGLGRAAEGLTAPSVPKVFGELGIEVFAVHQRVRALKNRQVVGEVDILCPARRNGSSLILVGEVKAHLTSEFVKYFLEDLPSFKENFPEYKEREVIGLVAGLNVDDDAAKYAKRKGLYVLAATGETMEITNPPDFKPKVW